ncbi:MAG: PDZ domain-containing protein [Ilumatobacteraceae bacterium]
MALAALRHPAAIIDTIASPTIQAAAVVTSVIPTQQPSVPGPPPAGRAPSKARRWWGIPLAVVGFAPILAVLSASFVPATAFVDKHDCLEVDADNVCVRRGPAEAVRYAVVPADASPAGSRLKVSGVEQFDDSSNLLFVTVREPELPLFEWWLADGNAGTSFFESQEDRFGTVTREEDEQIAVSDMRNAKNDAYFVALQKLGYPVTIDWGPAIIQQFSCFAVDDAGSCTKRSPAFDVLKAGDTITAVDGTPVATLPDLSPAINAHQAGDTVTITYERNGQSGTADVQLVGAPDDGRPLIGVQMQDTRIVTIPNDIKIDFETDNIGGPSAGLAFTLTLIDRLSEGDLTGGQKVAVTGTIDVNGDVGAIGGLRSKASAVQQAGAKYFIVPANQGDADIAAARKAAPGVEIIPVNTLDEALAALQRIGGDPFVPPAHDSDGGTASPSTTAPSSAPATTTP